MSKVILGSPITLFIVILIFIFMARTSYNIWYKSRETVVRLDQAKEALEQLNSRADDVSNKVAYLSTKKGIEAEIRTKFRAVENGESVAVIIDESNKNISSTTNTLDDISWWRKFLNFLGF